MDIDDFIASKHELPLTDGTTAICYLGTHLASLPEERVWITKKRDGSFTLEIENQRYIGDFAELEGILWEWFDND
jgi:hypothetical protein